MTPGSLCHLNRGKNRIGTSVRSKATWGSRLGRSPTIAMAFEFQFVVKYNA